MPGCRINEPQQQLSKRGFARSAFSHEAKHLAGSNLERDVVDRAQGVSLPGDQATAAIARQHPEARPGTSQVEDLADRAGSSHGLGLNPDVGHQARIDVLRPIQIPDVRLADAPYGSAVAARQRGFRLRTIGYREWTAGTE